MVLACLVLGGGLFALGYWQGERAMRQEISVLAAKGGNPLPGNNLARPDPGRGLGMPLILPPTIPANASPEMKEFMENRATLSKSFAELRSQMMKTNPPGSMQDAMQQFREQNKALLDRQQQLAPIIAQQQAKNPLPAPPPLQIPPNASPQMKDYLTARDQLMRDRIAFMNQHRTDDPATRQAAMQQWRQQNSDRFQQIQQLAQALAKTNQP